MFAGWHIALEHLSRKSSKTTNLPISLQIVQLLHTDNEVSDYASAIKKLDELAIKKQREMDYVLQ
eukprot:4126117-Prymnesium_polylepis.1